MKYIIETQCIAIQDLHTYTYYIGDTQDKESRRAGRPKQWSQLR